ncbi:hypothetical protein SFUMM280S_04571 [Streptomyces fumanus]
MIDLVAKDGTVILVKDFVWDYGTELHQTFTVDASALPANGTWKLRVTDNTPGIFTVDPGIPRRLEPVLLRFPATAA